MVATRTWPVLERTSCISCSTNLERSVNIVVLVRGIFLRMCDKGRGKLLGSLVSEMRSV